MNNPIVEVWVFPGPHHTMISIIRKNRDAHLFGMVHNVKFVKPVLQYLYNHADKYVCTPIYREEYQTGHQIV